jgi:hypothetical protein
MIGALFPSETAARRKIVTPHCSRPAPGFAVLAVFCSEFTADDNLALRRGRLLARCRRPATKVGAEKLMESLSYWFVFPMIKRET